MRTPEWSADPDSDLPAFSGPGQPTVDASPSLPAAVAGGLAGGLSGGLPRGLPRDVEAVDRVEAGAALTRLYRRWRSPLIGWLRGRGGDRSEAEDLTQQVFTRLWASGRLPADDGKAQAYLRQTARRIEIDQWRHAGQTGALQTQALDEEGVASPAAMALADDSQDPLRRVERRQQLARLRDALAELPARQGEALGLYLDQGLTQDEIAGRMGISTRMVSRHISRGLAYCTLRLQYGSFEQMQRLRTPDPDDRDDRDEPGQPGAGASPDRGGRGHG